VEKKFAHNLWGDAINIASRMESQSVAGKIHVSQEFCDAAGSAFRFIERGEVNIKGKGLARNYFMDV